ncbi:flagellar assembly factor FliW [Sporosarcina sp. NCCP-2222]|uniref:flagellar assembly protein FliW n=1 Tax=Sporosarcina sp. NCCP-2222 TaxID=2935073 RepID=UPI002080DC5D|nr:flagellar assembly protein FliW [Sporosarcina sp. NCCP-2222]GKV56696.1 flagellar assembly factor FliW [Sporosarcina sp. NCCP-2222]
MLINTKFHGEINITPDQIWSFPKGLPGFEEEREFVLLPIEGNQVFQVLQSTKTTEIAFIVANPYTWADDYTFDIDEPTMELLEINKEEDIFVLGVLSVRQPFSASTINLQAPLIFQIHNRKAKQMILNDNRFILRYPIGNYPEKGAN